jgi:methyl-accepting chemotaxis protein
MNGFEIPLGVLELLIPALCAGVLCGGTLLFVYIFLRSRELMYLSISFMGLFALVFVASELAILTFGGLLDRVECAMNFHRIEQISGAFFIFSLPFFMSYLLKLNRVINVLNRVVAFFGLAAAIAVAVIAFYKPSLFISMTEHYKTWQTIAGDHGRGLEGQLYHLRDTVLGGMILYSLLLIVIDIIWHRNIRHLFLPLIGVSLGILGAFNDTMYISERTNIFFGDIRFSRFALGVTLFIFFCMASLARFFVDRAREVARAEEMASREADRAKAQNDFVKNVIKTNTTSICGAMSETSASIGTLSENTRNQAASTEEMAAAVEEISAGANYVSSSADEQDKALQTLSGTINDLAGLVRAMGEAVTDTIGITEKVSDNAKSGEQSIRVMDESMRRIGDSSKQMNGIIRIINDISDRINLLSLNAAIEAARAGEAGRGFAVVADEISKLADQTATSIKEIDSLIRKNDAEISSGSDNIRTAVVSVNSIIHDVEGIAERIARVSELMKKQLSANDTVHAGVDHVRGRSAEIMSAMSEQKNNTDEITRAITGVSEIAQRNTVMANEMAESAKALVVMIEKLNMEIEEYRGD